MTLLNETRLFEKVLPHIGDKTKIISELIENAHRAHASKIDINLDEKKLTTLNDGEVLSDWPSLFTVGSTGHDELVVSSQLPAGMGVIMMISATSRASFHSGDKRIEIDCKKFFSSLDYRIEIEEMLNDPECLKVNEYIDGMKCSFDDDNGFFEALLSQYRDEDGILSQLNEFVYYDIDIVFNDEKITKRRLEWLFLNEGTGDLAGCQVGIESDNLSQGLGAVYWFGKRIPCKNIAPFSVVINEETPVIKPTLPDRNCISNDAGELARLHKQMELMSKSDIETLVESITDDTKLGGYDYAAYNYLFKILAKLTLAYDVEHFKYWVTDNSFHNRVALHSLVWCTENDSNIYFQGGQQDSVVLNDSGISLIAQSIGGCHMPQSFKDLYAERIDIEFVEHPKNELISGNFDGYEMCVCSSLTANGSDIDSWFDTNDGVVYLTPQSQIDEIINDMTVYSYEYPFSREVCEETWDEIQRVLVNELSVSNFMNALYKMTGQPESGFTAATIDLKKGLVTVQDNLGNDHAVKISDEIYQPYLKAS